MPDADVIPARQRGRHLPMRCALSRRAFSGGVAAAAGLALSGALPSWGAQDLMADLQAKLRGSVEKGDPPGLVALIARGDDVRVEVAGVRNLESRAPMELDTVFAVASIGKPITAVSALMLVKDGVLGLDDPVDPWLPELADRRVIRSLDADLADTVPAERPITLRDLLTMRMGLGAIFADPAGSPLLARMAELGLAPGPKLFGRGPDEFMARLGELPLVHQPGERWLYHTGLDVAGVLVARASGMSLGAFQRERIFAPLGMTDTGFHGPAERLATGYWRDPETGVLEVWNPAASDAGVAEPPFFEAGGGGHVSTVDDFLALGRMLLGGGAYRGQRLLAEASVAEMLTDQITPAQKAASPWFPPDFWETHGWGLGLPVRTAPAEAAGRFGWWGGFGTAFWCDPATDTVALLFTQRMMGGPDDVALAEAVLETAFGD
jgi:CubicO group peptidase (beta-lactamase class C family)